MDKIRKIGSVLNTDKDGFIILVNPRTINYFNSSEEELIGLNYNSFITVLRQICKFNSILYTSQIK